MSKTDLSAYYTPRDVARLLMSLVPLRRVRRVLDLCVGSGNLLAAARVKWPTAMLLGVDIDPGALDKCRNRFPTLSLFVQGDAALSAPSSRNLAFRGVIKGSYDVVLTNPPFLNRRHFDAMSSRILQGSDLRLPGDWPRVSRRMEAALLVHSFSYVTEGGYLAAIVPNGVLSCDRFASLRQWLLSQASRLTVVKLPEGTFDGVEVTASALVLKRSLKSKLGGPFEYTLREACLSRGVMVQRELYAGPADNTTFRLDNPHRLSLDSLISRRARHANALNDVASYIKRGVHVPKRQLGKTEGILYVHSTNMKRYGLDLAADRRYVTRPSARKSAPRTRHGDVLVVRVGKTLGRVCVVCNDSVDCMVSDCVCIIRPEGIETHALALLLQCEAVQQYYQNVARGSAARFITYHDLRSTPLPAIPQDVLNKLARRYRRLLRLPAQTNIERQHRASLLHRLIERLDLTIKSHESLQQRGTPMRLRA